MKVYNIRLISLVAILCCLCLLFSCKSSKKNTSNVDTQSEDSRIAKAVRMLEPIITGSTTLNLSEQQGIVNQVKDMNLTDVEVKSKIKDAEEAIKSRTPKKKLNKTQHKLSSYSKLNNSFDRIASTNNYNKSKQLINSALRQFTSKSTPVLIIISNHAGVVDYDKPTTIENYMSYLNDTNESPNKVHDIVYDSDKKISELVLIAK